MEFTLEQLNEKMKKNGGSLYLEGCPNITALPEGLTVGGYLDLEGCTNITALPEGLTVGGSLDLEGCTNITALPEGLTVGVSLYLRGTNITAADRKKIKPMPSVIVKEGRFIWCDRKLTHIKKVKKVREFTLYVGKIPGHNVVSDGTNFAHCKSLRDGIADLAFKSAKDRGAEQFKGLDLDAPRTPEELVTMYRIITGACRQGSEHFVESLGELKQTYTIREAIKLTSGQYGADRFKEFFE